MIIPKKYNKNKANDSNNCVIGSADGVRSAPRIVAKSNIGRQRLNIFFVLIILVKLSIT